MQQWHVSEIFVPDLTWSVFSSCAPSSSSKTTEALVTWWRHMPTRKLRCVYLCVIHTHTRHGAKSFLCLTGFNSMSPVTAPVMSIIPAWSLQHGVFELHLHPGQRHRFVSAPSVVLCAASWRLSICALLSACIKAVVTSQRGLSVRL